MLPEMPQISLCDECGTFFWLDDLLDDAEIVDRSDPMFPWEDRNNTMFPIVRFLGTLEYLEAVEAGVCRTTDEELKLRLLAWRAHNDILLDRKPSRRGRPAPEQKNRLLTDSEWRQNLEAILALTKRRRSPEHRLVRIEIYRELGDFEAAKAELSKMDTSGDWGPYVRCLRELCEKRDSRVGRVQLDSMG